jgi:hypothetical protein
MSTGKYLCAAVLVFAGVFRAAADAPTDGKTLSPPVAGEIGSAKRAAERYDEMLTRMQSAVEEIAELYGNPLFLQVFTNDEERAAALKQRLRSAGTADAMRKELAELQKKRDELLGDIALKEREAARLSERLARQRVALDSLASAVEQARSAVEETAK